MEPNDDLVDIMYLFEILQNINKIMYRYGKKRITAQDRLDAYCYMKKNGFSEVVNYIVDIAKSKFELDKVLEIQKQINIVCRKLKEKYQGYISEKNSFEYIKRKLESKNLEEFSDLEKKIVNTYYKKFYDYLVKLPRPVVGIYYKEDNLFKILCTDHFDNTIDKHTKIDLKSITQNSPIMAEIEAGYSIYTLHKDQKRKEELHDLEKIKYELEIQNLESDLELKEQEKIKNELDIGSVK